MIISPFISPIQEITDGKQIDVWGQNTEDTEMW